MKKIIFCTLFFVACGDDLTKVSTPDVTQDVSFDSKTEDAGVEVDSSVVEDMSPTEDVGVDSSVEQDTDIDLVVTEDVGIDSSFAEDIGVDSSTDVGTMDFGTEADSGVDMEPDIVTAPYYPRSCKEIFDDHPNDYSSYKTSQGNYIIFPDGTPSSSLGVKCLMDKHGGGWTLVGEYNQTTPPVDNFLEDFNGMEFENVLLIFNSPNAARNGEHFKTISSTPKTISPGWIQYTWTDWDIDSNSFEQIGRFELNEQSEDATWNPTTGSTFNNSNCSNLNCFKNGNFGLDKSKVYQNTEPNLGPIPPTDVDSMYFDKYLSGFGYANCSSYTTVNGGWLKCHAPDPELYWNSYALQSNESINLYLK